MRSNESQSEDRSRPLTAPVELRIHGVGGATPEILLGLAHTPLPKVRGHAFYGGSAAYAQAIADLGAVGTNQGNRT